MSTALATRTLDRAQRLSVTDLNVSDTDGTIAGGACAYNHDVDRGWGLFIRLLPGTFAEQVKDPARVKILFQHQAENPIGRLTELNDSPARLAMRGRIITHADRPVARQALADLRDGLIDEMSVGFTMLKWTVETEKADDGSTKYVYVVSRARLNEISVVTFGAMRDRARVTEVHSQGPSALHAAHAAAVRAELGRLTS